MDRYSRQGACAVIMRGDGYVLLNLRCKSAWVYPHHWAFIGGGVEEGESPLEALLRELQEEIEFKPLSEPELFETALYEKGGLVILDHTYLVKWKPPQILSLNEGEAIGWFSIDEALRLSNLPPHERGILEKLLINGS